MGHGFYNPQLDALVKEFGVTSDPVERSRLLQDLQNSIAEHMPYIPLWESATMSFHSKSLVGVEIDAMEKINFKDIVKVYTPEQPKLYPGQRVIEKIFDLWPF